jgi:hypothetical protein
MAQLSHADRRPATLRGMAARAPDARWHAAISGIAVAVLFGVGNAIWGLGMPEDGTPRAEVLDFYSDRADRIVIGGSLSMLAIAAFVWFAAAMRQLLIEAGTGDLVATTAFGGALLGMAAGLGAESINMAAALRAQDDELGEELAQSLFEISQILGSAATGVGLGVFGIATGAALLRARTAVPSWAAIATLALGVLLLTPLAHLNVLAGAAMIAMTATIGGALLRRL